MTEMSLASMSEIFDESKSKDIPFWRVILNTDIFERQVTEKQSYEKMSKMWSAMLSSDDNYRPELRSVSGLAGGDAAKYDEYIKSGDPICGPYISNVIKTALRVAESNACMRKIVAAPTAGACGVLPAVIIPMYRSGRIDEDEAIHSLYTASGIGSVIAFRASISGASGGCQAEIGTASAMAAGALTDLLHGNCEQIGNAVAMSIKNLLGLICDPVAGLVEIPCIKRNVIGAVNAICSAEMALAGIESRVPVDQVIDCMGDVGMRMPVEFRETALGGLAATQFGESVKEKMKSNRSI
jgi:L-serine dehydratase